MATKILHFGPVTLSANQSNDGNGQDPVPFAITTPTGVMRTIVEIRPSGTMPWLYTGQLNSEVQHQFDSNDINTYHLPLYVGLDIQGTDTYTIILTNQGSSSGTFQVDVVVEETATGQAGAGAPTGGE